MRVRPMAGGTHGCTGAAIATSAAQPIWIYGNFLELPFMTGAGIKIIQIRAPNPSLPSTKEMPDGFLPDGVLTALKDELKGSDSIVTFSHRRYPTRNRVRLPPLAEGIDVTPETAAVRVYPNEAPFARVANVHFIFGPRPASCDQACRFQRFSRPPRCRCYQLR
jgi:hypothetical protein